MIGGDVPADVRELLRQHVRSFETLEVLLVLHGSPHERWRADSLAERTGALAHACEQQRAELMSVMSTHAIERLRSGAMRAFADSFVFGQKKPDR